MPAYTFGETTPIVHATAWIAPSANLIGEVIVHEGASVWFNAVLRGDFGPIIVGPGANVQDGAVLHGGSSGTSIGRNATVGHVCVVHGARIGRSALIGNGAVVLDGATIGEEALVAANTTVAPNTIVPARTVIRGGPGRITANLTETARRWVADNAVEYGRLRDRYIRDFIAEPITHEAQGSGGVFPIFLDSSDERN